MPPVRRVPPERRKRTEISCDRCKSRKQKCHRPIPQAGNNNQAESQLPPCRYCEAHGFDCVATQPRKPRLYRVAYVEPRGTGTHRVADLGSDAVRDAQRHIDTPVLRDQQGQTQYIGPASSYLFQIRIRTLFAEGPRANNNGQFLLFGPNPSDHSCASEDGAPTPVTVNGTSPTCPTDEVQRPISGAIEGGSTPERGAGSVSGSGGAADHAKGVDGSSDGKHSTRLGEALDGIATSMIPEALIGAFFDNVHADFPILHEASFREEYERYCAAPTKANDPSWLCTLLCILILGRRKAKNTASILPGKSGQEAENTWWRKVQNLLPSVLFSSSVTAVQALLLAALHLNSTLHRDACWTLTGAAARIAFAVGLHRDSTGCGGGTRPLHTPLVRELRKRLWWTLHAFEQMQASSLDRPSSIDETLCSAGSPNEGILGVAGGAGELMVHANRLVVMLSRACRAVRDASLPLDDCSSGHTVVGGASSPVTLLLGDLKRWKSGLPPHLAAETADNLPPTWRRGVLLMHAQYYHVVSILSRNSLLALASKLSKPDVARNAGSRGSGRPSAQSAPPQETPLLADVCIDAAKRSAQILLALDKADAFDPVLWFDMYYIYSTSLTLVLGLFCEMNREGRRKTTESLPSPASASLALLEACSSVAAKHRRNPMIPGTNARFSVVVTDMNTMAREFAEDRVESATTPTSPAAPAQDGECQDEVIGDDDDGEESTVVAPESIPFSFASSSQQSGYHAPQLQYQQMQSEIYPMTEPDNPEFQSGNMLLANRTHMITDLSLGGESIPPLFLPPNTMGGGNGGQFLGQGFGFADHPWPWEDSHIEDIAGLLMNETTYDISP